MAVEMLERVSADKLMREEYNAREKARLDEISRLHYAEDKGRKEGIEEGKRQSAINFLNMGISIEDVAKGSGLPLEEVRKLKGKKK